MSGFEYDYNLISFKLCPYVQRSVITLEEKRVPFTIEYIDLYDKPAWFLEISPLGRVPVLRSRDAVIFESAVINEFIEETTPGPQLHPEDPLRRAHNRAWIEVASELLRKLYRLQTAAEEEQALRAAAEARDVLARFEKELGRSSGPLFNGSFFSLVDAAAASALQRLTWCQEIVPSLGLYAGAPRVEAWRDALLSRQSVRLSTVPESRELFVEYLQGRGSPSRNVEASWVGRQAT
jgi:glutathione S-transferase